jgi:hypothetical protein
MAEAVVNLVSLGLAFLAVILTLVAPLAAIIFILWNWHKESGGMNRSRKMACRHVEEL